MGSKRSTNPNEIESKRPLAQSSNNSLVQAGRWLVAFFRREDSSSLRGSSWCKGNNEWWIAGISSLAPYIALSFSCVGLSVNSHPPTSSPRNPKTCGPCATHDLAPPPLSQTTGHDFGRVSGEAACLPAYLLRLSPLQVNSRQEQARHARVPLPGSPGADPPPGLLPPEVRVDRSIDRCGQSTAAVIANRRNDVTRPG